MRRRNLRAARAIALTAQLAVVATLLACGGDAAGDGAMSWTTVADSTGDTIRVRIEGEVPDRLLRSLVPELRIGAVDGSEEETFGQVEVVAGLADGGLFVYDAQAQALRMFDAQGAFVRQVGGKGGGPGEHGHVNGIAKLPDGGWVLWDAPGARINEYAPNGDFRSGAPLPITGFFMQDGLQVDRQGLRYAWAALERDPATFSVQKAGFIRLDAAGTVRDTLIWPNWGIQEAVLGTRSPDGRVSTAAQLPWGPNSTTAFHPDGGLIATPGASEYVWYRLLEGERPMKVERSHTPVPVSATESGQRRAQIERTMKRVNPDWNWTGPGIPDTKPAIRGLKVGEDGRVWIRLYTAGEPIPEEQLAPVPDTPNPPVRITTREPDLWEVFAADGRLLARIKPPPRTTLIRFSGNHVWGRTLDSLDVQYAVRYRIEPALPE